MVFGVGWTPLMACAADSLINWIDWLIDWLIWFDLNRDASWRRWIWRDDAIQRSAWQNQLYSSTAWFRRRWQRSPVFSNTGRSVASFLLNKQRVCVTTFTISDLHRYGGIFNYRFIANYCENRRRELWQRLTVLHHPVWACIVDTPCSFCSCEIDARGLIYT